MIEPLVFIVPVGTAPAGTAPAGTASVAPGEDDEAVRRTVESLPAGCNLEVVPMAALDDRLRRATGRTNAADGETESWLAFVAAGDVVEPTAIMRCSITATATGADLVYGDAVRSSAEHGREALHRPAWSPLLLTAQMYFRGLWFARADHVAEALATAEGVSSLHDLALRLGECCSAIVSIPRILCELDPGPRADDVDLAAIDAHFERVGMPARAVAPAAGGESASFEQCVFQQGVVQQGVSNPSSQQADGSQLPLVSLLVPTGGSRRIVRGVDTELVSNAISSVVAQTSYPNYEIVVVIDSKSPDELGERLAALDDRVRVVRDTRSFNYSAANNLAAEHASGSVLVMLNDDTEVVTSDWLERIVTITRRDDVGALGARLLYEDGRLQHGGVISRHGGPDHIHHGHPGSTIGHLGRLGGLCEMLAVTGACLAVRRDHWDAIGGMNEALPINYNDVDLCLRLADLGWRTVFDGATTLLHLETSTRVHGTELWEQTKLQEDWGRLLWDDPYDNPNLRTLGVAQVAPPPGLTALRGVANEAPAQVFRSTPGGHPVAIDDVPAP